MKSETYEDNAVDDVLDYVMNFLREIFYEDDMSDKDSRNDSRTTNKPPPVFIVMDTAQLMDEASWKLLDMLKNDIQKLVIVILIQTINNQPQIIPEA